MLNNFCRHGCSVRKQQHIIDIEFRVTLNYSIGGKGHQLLPGRYTFFCMYIDRVCASPSDVTNLNKVAFVGNDIIMNRFHFGNMINVVARSLPDSYPEIFNMEAMNDINPDISYKQNKNLTKWYHLIPEKLHKNMFLQLSYLLMIK